jgi:stage II sporulation protein D
LRKRVPIAARAIAALAVAAMLPACAPRHPVTLPPRPPTASVVRVGSDRGVDTVAIEDYVAGCVAAELGSIRLDPPSAARARDVQAILCRSFALGSVGRHAAEGFDLCATTHCQVFRPVPATVIGRLCREAAARTARRILTVGGRPILPMYHADCGGYTSAVEDVWGGTPASFLVAARDDACPRQPRWRLEVTLERLANILRDDPKTAVAGPLGNVEVDQRDAAGRAAWIRLAGRPARVVRGADFRAAVLHGLGPASLRSTLFTVTRRAGTLVFEGSGNGHGVGLCQAGMLARAGRGAAPADILAHYFPGVAITDR